MEEEIKYSYLSEKMKKIYSDSLKKLKAGEISLDGALDIFYEHLNFRYQENDKLLKDLESSKNKIEFLESHLTAVYAKYLNKFSEEDKPKVVSELVKRLLNENQ